MSTIATRKLGRTGVKVTELGFGGAPLGELFEFVPPLQAQATLQAAWDAGIRYYDTSPFYGYGKSEHRLGHFLREQPHKEYVVSTKVGRVMRATRKDDVDDFDGGLWAGALPFEPRFDYSYDGIMRSYEDSLTRLGVHRIELLLIHDLDHFFHTEPQVQAYLNQMFTSGWRALEELKSNGDIKGIGAGLNKTGMMPRFLDMMPLDFFIVAMPYTLLDQSALDGEFPRCQDNGVGIVIGAVFASGILVTGPKEGAMYAYAPAEQDILEKTRKIETVCQQHGVALPAAAMQFPLGHPIVAAIIPGALKPEYIQSNIELLQQQIPADMWSELKHEGLIRADAPTP